MNSIYTQVSGGKFVDKTSKLKIHLDNINLVKSNYLGEFKTNLEKSKVKRNLGIVDLTTITWEDIQGLPNLNSSLNDYVQNIPFDPNTLSQQISIQDADTLNKIIVSLNNLIDELKEFKLNTESLIATLLGEINILDTRITYLENIVYAST